MKREDEPKHNVVLWFWLDVRNTYLALASRIALSLRHSSNLWQSAYGVGDSAVIVWEIATTRLITLAKTNRSGLFVFDGREALLPTSCLLKEKKSSEFKIPPVLVNAFARSIQPYICGYIFPLCRTCRTSWHFGCSTYKGEWTQVEWFTVSCVTWIYWPGAGWANSKFEWLSNNWVVCRENPHKGRLLGDHGTLGWDAYHGIPLRTLIQNLCSISAKRIRERSHGLFSVWLRCPLAAEQASR